MNNVMMQAFYDELEKIADWALSGPALHQFSAQQIRSGAVPEGFGLGTGGLEQTMKAKEMATSMGQQAAAAREAKMNQMLQSGQWNPKTHTVDMQGNLVAKKPMTTPTPRPSTTAATAVGGRPVAPGAVGPGGTQILHGAAAGAPRAAAGGMAGRLGRIGSKIRGAGKMGLGLAALGLAGGAGGGYAAAQP